MRYLPLALLLASVCVFAEDAEPSKSGSTDTGRYRLLRAAITDRTIERQCVFKIDSSTGRTWRYFEYVTKTNIDYMFVEVRTFNLPAANSRPVTSPLSESEQSRLADVSTKLMLVWCREHPAGGTIDLGHGEKIPMSAAAVAEILSADAEDYSTNHPPFLNQP